MTTSISSKAQRYHKMSRKLTENKVTYRVNANKSEESSSIIQGANYILKSDILF